MRLRTTLAQHSFDGGSSTAVLTEDQKEACGLRRQEPGRLKEICRASFSARLWRRHVRQSRFIRADVRSFDFPPKRVSGRRGGCLGTARPASRSDERRRVTCCAGSISRVFSAIFGRRRPSARLIVVPPSTRTAREKPKMPRGNIDGRCSVSGAIAAAEGVTLTFCLERTTPLPALLPYWTDGKAVIHAGSR